MSAYREFTGKTVEEALRIARDEFGVGLDELDFEILTPGSRGVLGMGAEPARIVAAPRSELGGAAPKREAAAARPLPPPPAREGHERGGRDRDRGGFRDARPRRDEPPVRDERPAPDVAPVRDMPPVRDEPAVRDMPPVRDERQVAPRRVPEPAPERRREERPRRDERPPDGRGRRPERTYGGESAVSEADAAEVAAARSVAREREELQAAEASPETLAAGKEILEALMGHLGFEVKVVVAAGETSRLNVVGEGDEREALGALIGRKGERLSALQHLVNLMLSRRIGEWTRVLVDVEDYRGRRERQLVEIARRAAERVTETGKMLQLEPMPALERRWIHIALRDHPDVATQSIGEEPNRRIVVLPRG